MKSASRSSVHRDKCRPGCSGLEIFSRGLGGGQSVRVLTKLIYFYYYGRQQECVEEQREIR
jgi:hypothetical protein